MVALGPQTARVVLQIAEHGIELAPALQDAVVVTLFPEGGQLQRTGNPITTDLEAVDDMAQMAWQSICHMDDAVQVVGHELNGEQPYLGIKLGYFAPALSDEVAEGRGIEPGLGMAVVRTANGAQ